MTKDYKKMFFQYIERIDDETIQQDTLFLDANDNLVIETTIYTEMITQNGELCYVLTDRYGLMLNEYNDESRKEFSADANSIINNILDEYKSNSKGIEEFKKIYYKKIYNK